MAHPNTISSDNGNRLAAAALTLLLILFISINVLSSGWLTSARLDLTKDKLYTLSDSTIKLLKDVKESISPSRHCIRNQAQLELQDAT